MHQMSINQEWSSRPQDERYTSLTALAEATAYRKSHSNARVVASKSLTADIEDNKLVIRGPSGQGAIPTNWAFGQLAARAGAPAGYLRDLPQELVVDCLNYGLHVARPVEDIGVLLHKNGGPAKLHAVTGPNYGRIWDANVAEALVEAFGDGRTGSFRIPRAVREQVAITKDNTTLYASDRDMVGSLADEDKSTEVQNRRDGKSGRVSTGLASATRMFRPGVVGRVLGLRLHLLQPDHLGQARPGGVLDTAHRHGAAPVPLRGGADAQGDRPQQRHPQAGPDRRCAAEREDRRPRCLPGETQGFSWTWIVK